MSNQVGDKPEDQQANGASEDEEVIVPEDEAVEDDGEDAPLEAEPEPTDLEKARAERDRMREQLLRIAADFDNFRKRSRKEIEEVRRRTVEDTLREVLPSSTTSSAPRARSPTQPRSRRSPKVSTWCCEASRTSPTDWA